jgi:shikimate dehydrogenase
VLLLGAGGAARAVAFALLDSGVSELVLANRSQARALALGDMLAQPERVCVSDWEALKQRGTFNVIVNATSIGLHGGALNLSRSLASKTTVAYDLSYGAAAEPFLHWAHAAGAAIVVSGLGMLIETAADSFEHWHRRRPDTEPALRELCANMMQGGS